MRARPFAVLVSAGSYGIYATQLPTVLKDEGAYGVLNFHLARANPHWKYLAECNEALMIFQGPEGYITPNWYPSKAEHQKVVPTWNYAVVHAYGRPDVTQNGVDTASRSRIDRSAEKKRDQAVGADRCARNLHLLRVNGTHYRAAALLSASPPERTVHHWGEDDNIQVPAATQATPAARAIHHPNGVTFSKRTSSARTAIQSTFITPLTNKSAISTQQQPTQ